MIYKEAEMLTDYDTQHKSLENKKFKYLFDFVNAQNGKALKQRVIIPC